MIWIHTYGVGKFGRVIRRTVHYTERAAIDSQKVLGGTLKAYIEKKEGFNVRTQ